MKAIEGNAEPYDKANHPSKTVYRWCGGGGLLTWDFSMTVTYQFRAGSGYWTIIGYLVVLAGVFDDGQL